MGKRFTLDLPAAVRAFYREAAARRRLEPRQCAVCSKRFVATPRRQYCSAACSQRAYRARHRPPPRPVVRAARPAPPPLAVGDWVELLRALDDTAAGRRGCIVALPSAADAEVEFGTP